MVTVYSQSMGASLTPKILDLIKTAGCEYIQPGHRGNHDIWQSPITNVHFPVDSKIRSTKAANILLKIAGLPPLAEENVDGEEGTGQ
jgi:hypothetical protein